MSYGYVRRVNVRYGSPQAVEARPRGSVPWFDRIINIGESLSPPRYVRTR